MCVRTGSLPSLGDLQVLKKCLERFPLEDYVPVSGDCANHDVEEESHDIAT